MWFYIIVYDEYALFFLRTKTWRENKQTRQRFKTEKKKKNIEIPSPHDKQESFRDEWNISIISIFIIIII